MKSLIFLTLIILVCTGSRNKVDSYFKFDEVEHFKTDYKKYEQEGESIYSKTAKNEQEEDLLNILLSPKASFLDTVLIKKLEGLGFNKLKVSSEKVDQLKRLFKPKKLQLNEIVFCDPIYNDVLIFRNKNKVVGFAKICFGCGQMIITGENLIDRITAPNENFYKLENLLRE